MALINGILNINKDKDMTSHDVVAILRGVVGQKKIGHTGTLDPMVTGVLPICLGQATRVSEYISAQGKTYEGTMIFGFETDTLDVQGQVIKEAALPDVNEDSIEKAFTKFRGRIDQVPPMYSAIKVKGQRLYDLARAGKEVERKARSIEIYSLDLLSFDDKSCRFRCSCSKGTYIRQLVKDIGVSMGSLATLQELVRTRVGPYAIEDAIPIAKLKDGLVNWQDSIQRVDSGLQIFDALELNEKEAELALHGVKLKVGQQDLKPGLLYRIYGPKSFIGLGYLDEAENRLRMKKVLTH